MLKNLNNRGMALGLILGILCIISMVVMSTSFLVQKENEDISETIIRTRLNFIAESAFALFATKFSERTWEDRWYMNSSYKGFLEKGYLSATEYNGGTYEGCIADSLCEKSADLFIYCEYKGREQVSYYLVEYEESIFDKFKYLRVVLHKTFFNQKLTNKSELKQKIEEINALRLNNLEAASLISSVLNLMAEDNIVETIDKEKFQQVKNKITEGLLANKVTDINLVEESEKNGIINDSTKAKEAYEIAYDLLYNSIISGPLSPQECEMGTVYFQAEVTVKRNEYDKEWDEYKKKNVSYLNQKDVNKIPKAKEGESISFKAYYIRIFNNKVHILQKLKPTEESKGKGSFFIIDKDYTVLSVHSKSNMPYGGKGAMFDSNKSSPTNSQNQTAEKKSNLTSEQLKYAQTKLNESIMYGATWDGQDQKELIEKEKIKIQEKLKEGNK